MKEPLPLRLARRLAAPWRWLFGVFHSPNLYGEASFLSEEAIARRFSPRNRGIVLSERVRFTLEDSFTNVAVLAPTGSGKSTRYVTPNLLQLEGSFLITDPAGELFARTSGYLAQQGWSIFVLDLTHPAASHQFNPLPYLSGYSERRKLARSICAHDVGSRSDPFWSNMAANLLTIGLQALASGPASHNTLANLRWLLNHLAFSERAREYVAEALAEHPPVLAEFQAFLAQEEKLIDNRVRAGF